jgi:hypothetical protein
VDDEWNPESEPLIDAGWLEREHERLRQREEEWAARRAAQQAAEDEIVNGARRERDGRFAVHRERVCRTDGSSALSQGEYEELLLRIQAQLRKSGAVSPVLALESAKAMRGLCDELEYEAVAIARGFGWSWRDIGESLGLSESGAHRRFAGSLAPRRRLRRSS